MSGFIGNDGSELAGALNPSSVIQGLQVDANGNLKVIGGVAGAPLVVEANIQNWIRNGQGFAASSGLITGANAAQYPLSIFNPSNSGKSLLIYRAGGAANGGATFFSIYKTTVDPAYANAVTPINLKLGGAASVANATAAAGSANLSLPGSGQIRITLAGNYAESNLLLNGGAILLPAGSANGITIFIYNSTATTGQLMHFAEWIEF